MRPLIRQSAITVPTSDGTIERAGVDVMHFPFQAGFLTSVPSIYQPHDLQHLHLPQFFSERERAARETIYPALCRQAQLVVVMSSWGKADLITSYGLPERKVAVVPGAPALDAYSAPSDADLVATRRKYALPDTFAFYPAQTWPHKNHIGLLEALAIVRDRRGLRISCVFTGRLNDHYPRIAKRIRELQLGDQVRFLGFVPPKELSSLYGLCRCMVFPTKFEGWGLPITEAFSVGVPVACSNVTCLPEQTEGAALLFNPESPEEIADAVFRLWTDERLRRMLIEKGTNRAAEFTWEHTARVFRAHYRSIAGGELTEEDRALICLAGASSMGSPVKSEQQTPDGERS